MSGSLLRRLLAVGLTTRRINLQAQQAFGDDGARYPRDFYRPAELLVRQPSLYR